MRITEKEMLAPSDIPYNKVPPYRIKVEKYILNLIMTEQLNAWHEP
jgi:hypothetical protein